MPDANTLLQLRFETDVTTDEGQHGYSWTNSGVTRVTSAPKYGTGNALFDNADSMFTGTISQFASPGPSAFCVEAWVKGATSAKNFTLFDGNIGAAFSLSVAFGASGTLWEAGRNNGGSFSAIFSRLATVQASSDSNWHHVAMTFDGATYRLFWDGVLKDSFSSTTKAWQASAFLQLNRGVASAEFDNFRLSDVARYTADFTPADFETLFEVADSATGGEALSLTTEILLATSDAAAGSEALDLTTGQEMMVSDSATSSEALSLDTSILLELSDGATSSETAALTAIPAQTYVPGEEVETPTKPAIPPPTDLHQQIASIFEALTENVEFITGRRGGKIERLSGSATTAEIITKVNEVIDRLQS